MDIQDYALIKKTELTALADAYREKSGTTEAVSVGEIAEGVLNLSNSSDIELGVFNITKNGEYEAAITGGLGEESRIEFTALGGTDTPFGKIAFPASWDKNTIINYALTCSIEIAAFGYYFNLAYLSFIDYPEYGALMWRQGQITIVYDYMQGIASGLPFDENGIYTISPPEYPAILIRKEIIPIGGYNKITTNILTGGLDWKEMPAPGSSPIRTAITGSTFIISGEVAEIPDFALSNESTGENLPYKTLIVLPGVTKIGKENFAWWSLNTVFFPETITYLGPLLFNFTSVDSIVYAGTVEQWNAIEKSSSWKGATSATYVQCSDGQAPIE